MAKIVDVVTLNDETDIWDIHYNVLKDHVDEFRVIVFDKTFSGKKKAKFFPDFDWDKYPKAKWYLNTEYTYGKYKTLAEHSPNTLGAEHWKLEFQMKESIKDRLTDLVDDDIVYCGDVDEVWNPESKIGGTAKLNLGVYTYYLNNRSNEEFYGTLRAPYRVIKESCLNELRSNKNLYLDGEAGWHFTSMASSLHKKLTDSYTHESYATPTILDNLEYNISHGKDFLGRDYRYHIDESQWPQYLKDHKEKYAHLCE